MGVGGDEGGIGVSRWRAKRFLFEGFWNFFRLGG